MESFNASLAFIWLECWEAVLLQVATILEVQSVKHEVANSKSFYIRVELKAYQVLKKQRRV